MTWGLVVAFIVGVYCGMVAMAILTMSRLQDDWQDSL